MSKFKLILRNNFQKMMITNNLFSKVRIYVFIFDTHTEEANEDC